MKIPVPGEKYVHFKGGLVEILAIATHSETLETLVIYTHNGEVWARPLSIFMSRVDKLKYPDATQKYRFKKLY